MDNYTQTGRVSAILLIVYVVLQISVFWYFSGMLILLYSVLLMTSSVVLVFCIKKYSFLIMSIMSLGLAFGLTFWSNFQGFTESEQFKLMFLHIGYMSSVAIIWFILQSLDRLIYSQKMMNLQLEDLKKYVQPEFRVLTNREFLDRVELVMVGLRRRKEEGYIMKVDLSSSPSVEISLHEQVVRSIEKSIRAHYDLLTTNENKKTLLIFLQNTTKTGCDVVKFRIEQDLRKKTSFIELPITITFSLIKDVDELQRTFLAKEVSKK